MSYQRTVKNIDVLICESGLILKIADIQRISVKPFSSEDRVVEKLRGDENPKTVYFETRNDGIQSVDLENKFNNEFNLGSGSFYDKGETMLKCIVESWLKLNN